MWYICIVFETIRWEFLLLCLLKNVLPCVLAFHCSFAEVFIVINAFIEDFLCGHTQGSCLLGIWLMHEFSNHFCWFSPVIVFLQNTADQIAFRAAGGLTALEHVLQATTAPTNLNAASRIPFKYVWSFSCHLVLLEYSFNICFTASASFLPCSEKKKSCSILCCHERWKTFPLNLWFSD